MAIQNLPSVVDITGAEEFSVASPRFGADARVSLPLLVEYLRAQLDEGGSMVTQYAAPNATGFSIQIGPVGVNAGTSIWLILTPTAGFAAGTIVLPQALTVVDKQELLVNTTQAVTALTVSGNGATVYGAPTSLAANAFFRLRYDVINNGWYRVN